MTTHTAQVDDLRLVALPNAVNCTALFVRFTLREWSLSMLRDRVERMACDLVSAVVEDANPASPHFLTVRLRLRGEHLSVEVEDDEPMRPHAKAPAYSDTRSGIESYGARGKMVWCELALPGGVNATSVTLPRRDGRRSVVPESVHDEVYTQNDPEILGRILSGLTRG
ncbi:ATP-binding protein [Amycolatopsis suaedae]|uniref:ATP-binding protein n=1 Tax=Amycolatopsis suaedae TaxID=2510978 RepID=A0A4V2ELL3_9PSEU|nr:ATP-binding protein [Amycolatopsis suaedae]RZQ61965.1 ATP-binding protein [Amycolatopsis suaedae]